MGCVRDACVREGLWFPIALCGVAITASVVGNCDHMQFDHMMACSVGLPAMLLVNILLWLIRASRRHCRRRSAVAKAVRDVELEQMGDVENGELSKPLLGATI